MTREEQQPMSEARLAEIRERHEAMSAYYAADLDATYPAYPDLPHDYLCDVDELLADNERLRAREAALVAVVRAVADARGTDSLHDDTIFLRRSGAERVIEQARALLASAAEAEAAQGEA